MNRYSLLWGFMAVSLTAVEGAVADRLRPPEAVNCPRDHLTSYSGKVSQYLRRMGQTRIQIDTDWGTVEKVVVVHPGKDDPSQWFLVDGVSFTPNDWIKIESRKNHLRPGIRATAWVCDDGRNPVINWDLRR